MKTFPFFLIACLASIPLLVPTTEAHTHAKRFHDAKYWETRFDDPKRDKWQKPDQVIEALQVKESAVVADLGAGTGYLSVRLAKALPKSTVIAGDIEASLVEHIQKRAKKDKLTNLKAERFSPTEPKLSQAADIAIMVNTYHHIDDRVAYFKTLLNSLNKGGLVAIVDFNETSTIGPPKAERIPSDKVKEEMQAAGYTFAEAFDFLPNQYFLVFKR